MGVEQRNGGTIKEKKEERMKENRKWQEIGRKGEEDMKGKRK